jgi:hydrogenase expression/formation protein HypD
MLAEVFEVCDRSWRGIGLIPRSGWRLTAEFARFDAERRFDVGDLTVEEPSECRAGEVLQGMLRPDQCEWFGTTCTPRTPMGATMVSSEGACAAYHQYRRVAIPVSVRRG